MTKTDKADKAYNRLKEFKDFSPNFDTFESLFWDNLDRKKTDEAIELLLQVTFKMLTSHGEIFNEVIDGVGGDKANEFKAWITKQRTKL